MKKITTKEKLYHQVYMELRDYIIQNNMKPGDMLPTEMEMTQALGVSRNVLREAMKSFEIMGVLTSKSGVGVMLNSFNPSFLSSCIFLNLIADSTDLVEQSQEARKVMELGFSKESFDAVTPQSLEKLEGILQKMNEGSDLLDFYELDALFHKTLLEPVGNYVLIAFIEAAWNCDKYYRTQYVHDPLLRFAKHSGIVKALQERDYEKYLEVLEFHFSYIYKKKSTDCSEVTESLAK